MSAESGVNPYSEAKNGLGRKLIDMDLPDLPPVWDPEVDEMPSPFLKRDTRNIRLIR
jgi:hypothetical protein